ANPPALNAEMVDYLRKRNLPLTQESLDSLTDYSNPSSRMNQLNDTIGQAVASKPGQQLDLQAAMDAGRARVAKLYPDLPGAATEAEAALDKQLGAYVSPGGNAWPVQATTGQNLKVSLGRILHDSFGDLSGPSKEVLKGVRYNLAEQISSAFPEVGPANA